MAKQGQLFLVPAPRFHWSVRTDVGFKSLKLRMTVEQYRKLVGHARAFLKAAWFIEKEICRLNAQGGNPKPIEGPTGWRSHDVWVSLKAVSHFNLGISFELRLKLLLKIVGIKARPGRDGHDLVALYNDLPPEISKQLDEMFFQAIKHKPFDLLTFATTNSPVAPKVPRNRKLDTLNDFCAYLDKDVKIWKKRYSWEENSAAQWVHYLDNLDPLMVFLESIDEVGEGLAREAGVLK